MVVDALVPLEIGHRWRLPAIRCRAAASILLNVDPVAPPVFVERVSEQLAVRSRASEEVLTPLRLPIPYGHFCVKPDQSVLSKE